ncbi:hypothetical protein MTP99_004561 [Tenebrio molitor]|uniref:general odorant-binding protein 19d-like n=1 Tax=Tenebrio molitor TaxID=7067 RepID=UPI001C3A6584|nr:hypothetical protein MTP99_004561 [Tenebrio molitor]CAH1380587.1 unnamed protein product [Tenebrio molitor]
MKFVTLTLFYFVAASAADKGFLMSEKFADVREDCLKENSMTIDDLKSGWTLEEIPEKNLCFHKCLMQKKEVIDENGDIQKDKISEFAIIPHLDEDKRNEVIECILSAEKIENCQDVTKILNCFPRRKKD